MKAENVFNSNGKRNEPKSSVTGTPIHRITAKIENTKEWNSEL
jgi:hypothetical protein